MRNIMKLDTSMATMAVIGISVAVELIGGNGFIAGVVAMLATMPFLRMKRNHRICQRS